MFTSFKVERLRGLESLEVNGLERVTLITGRNNAGKTALLEGMLLFSGHQNPQIVMMINAIRGMTKVSIEAMPEDATPWQSVFWNFDDETSIRLSGSFKTEKGVDHTTVTISTVRSGVELSGLAAQLRQFNLVEGGSVVTKVLKVDVKEGRRSKSSKHFLVIDGKGQRVFPPPESPPFRCRFLTGHHRDTPEEMARQFSLFATRGQVGLLVEAMLPMAPQLHSLELLFTGEPMLHGNIGTSTVARYIPLPLLGDGINRVAAIVLAIGSTSRGVVLVDDIDTGIHHSVMKQFWESVFRAARAFNTQVIATTHSDECVYGALQASKAVSDSTDHMSLIRLERIVIVRRTPSLPATWRACSIVSDGVHARLMVCTNGDGAHREGSRRGEAARPATA